MGSERVGRGAVVVAAVAACCATIGVAGGATAPGAQPRTAHFQSPSGNIDCYLDAEVADCLVKKNTWARLPAKPQRCDLDWNATEIELSRHRVFVGGCRGDVGPLCMPHTALSCTTLAYGRSLAIGPIRCTSAFTGVTCRRRDGSHVGFLIARERYVVYR